MIVTHKGEVEADLPVDNARQLGAAVRAPLGRRPCRRRPILPEWVPAPNAILDTLKTMMGAPHLCSRRWIWEQYDHMVMGDTVQRPGGDAAVVRVHGTTKGLAAHLRRDAALRAPPIRSWAPSRPWSRAGAI